VTAGTVVVVRGTVVVVDETAVVEVVSNAAFLTVMF
jgi:hypothetical protein